MAAIIIAVSLLVIVLGIAATVMVRAYLAQRIDWKPIAYGLSYADPLNDQATALRLCNAFRLATMLYDYPVAFPGLRIYVSSQNKWHDSSGTLVAGQTISKDEIIVGRDLKSLMHELRHVAAWRTTGDPDCDHKGWSTDAEFQSAISYYEANVK